MIVPVHLAPTVIRSAHHGGERPVTQGVVVHSTRGGRGPGYELLSTINWLRQNPQEVSAHAVVGTTGAWWELVPSVLIAHHARAFNDGWLGIEFEQGSATDEFTEAQFVVGAYIVHEWAADFGFEIGSDTVIGHEKIDAQKSDPGERFPWTRFLLLCKRPQLALPEDLRDFASPTYPDLLDAANSLRGIIRDRDRQRASAETLVQQAAIELAAR